MGSPVGGGFWTGKTIALVAFAATAAFVGLLGWRAQTATCQEVVVSNHPSPEGAWVARSFFTDCGWMRGFTTRLALRRTGDAFVPGPRGLVDSGLVLVAGKRLPIQVEWIGDDTLSLSCMGCRKTPMFWVRKTGNPVVSLFDSAGSILERP